MPRSSVVLSSEPLGHAVIASAASEVRARALGDAAIAPDVPVELRTVDDGAVLQVLVDGVVMLSLLRPRLLPRLDEVSRLLPLADPPVGTRWWADAYTPWQPEGAIGTEILDAAASASGSLVVHQGLASRADGPDGRGVSDG